MNILVSRFFEICLLRAGPQDLPASTVLLVLTLILYLVSGLLLSLINADLGKSLLLVGVDFLMLVCLAYLILWIRMLTRRYVQTLTALAGSGAILELTAWPLLYWQSLTSATSGLGLLVASLLLWVWLVWNVLVVAHILRHTLTTSFFNGTLLSVLYMFISVSVIRILLYSTSA